MASHESIGCLLSWSTLLDPNRFASYGASMWPHIDDLRPGVVYSEYHHDDGGYDLVATHSVSYAFFDKVTTTFADGRTVTHTTWSLEDGTKGEVFYSSDVRFCTDKNGLARICLSCTPHNHDFTGEAAALAWLTRQGRSRRRR